MMKSFSLILFSLLCWTVTFGQFVPPQEDRISVTTDADGVLTAPSTFWTANDASIYSALELTSAATGDAAGLTSGTLNDNRLSTNIPRLGTDFDGTNYTWGNLTTHAGFNIRGDLEFRGTDAGPFPPGEGQGLSFLQAHSNRFRITVGGVGVDDTTTFNFHRNGEDSTMWFRPPPGTSYSTAFIQTDNVPEWASGYKGTFAVDETQQTVSLATEDAWVELTYFGDESRIIDVDRNEDKLALTNIRPGQRVRIVEEGGRIEMYLGESETTGLIDAAEVSISVSSGDSEIDDRVAGTYFPEGTYNGKTRYVNSSGVFMAWYFSYWELEDPIEGNTAQSGDFDNPWDGEWMQLYLKPVVSQATGQVTTGPESDANWVTLTEGGRRLPLFFIPIPWSSGFTDFELKASVSNFTGASVEDRFKYIYHSPDPDLEEAMFDVKPLVWFTRSGPTQVIEHRQQPSDASIASTLPASSEVGGIYVLVRGDAAWMYEGNVDLLWAYVLFEPSGPNEDTLDRQIWTPIRPEWISPSRIPSFLDTGD